MKLMIMMTMNLVMIRRGRCYDADKHEMCSGKDDADDVEYDDCDGVQCFKINS